MARSAVQWDACRRDPGELKRALPSPRAPSGRRPRIVRRGLRRRARARARQPQVPVRARIRAGQGGRLRVCDRGLQPHHRARRRPRARVPQPRYLVRQGARRRRRRGGAHGCGMSGVRAAAAKRRVTTQTCDASRPIRPVARLPPQIGLHDEAIADFTRVLALDPSNANAYFNRCGAGVGASRAPAPTLPRARIGADTHLVPRSPPPSQPTAGARRTTLWAMSRPRSPITRRRSRWTRTRGAAAAEGVPRGQKAAAFSSPHRLSRSLGRDGRTALSSMDHVCYYTRACATLRTASTAPSKCNSGGVFCLRTASRIRTPCSI